MPPSNDTSATAAPGELAVSYKACDTVVLLCLALASSVLVLAVAFCFRRAFPQQGDATATDQMAVAGRSDGGRRGLAPSVLVAIPKFAYNRRTGGGGWTQCAICLGVARDGEVVRRLPACRHLFHVECIDLWLDSHATCPLCRRDVAVAVGDKVLAGRSIVRDTTTV